MLENDDLRHIILNVRQPTVLKNLQTIRNWPIFSSTFEKWAAAFDAAQVNETLVDEGCRQFPNVPQFECFRTKKPTKLRTMLVENDTTGPHWRCHNYKYLKDCPITCHGGVNYSDLGFNEVGDDVSFWVGQSGSHTPCHYDTYGCNVVIQIFGRKSWLLFPPTTCGMAASRVPYEESSVYSALNFYSPDPAKFADFERVRTDAYHIILEPGSVLVVPPKWWHYVECMTNSLNFNTWIKLDTDLQAQIDECVTRIHVRELVARLDPATAALLLNPNEADLLSESIRDLQATLTYLQNLKTSGQCLSNQQNRHAYLSDADLSHLLDKYQSNVHSVERLSAAGFEKLLKENSKRFTSSISDARVTDFQKLLENPQFLDSANS